MRVPTKAEKAEIDRLQKKGIDQPLTSEEDEVLDYEHQRLCIIYDEHHSDCYHDAKSKHDRLDREGKDPLTKWMKNKNRGK